MAIAVRVLDNYVGGSWTPSTSDDGLDVTNPATGDVLARVQLSSRSDLDDAVAAPRPAGAACRSRCRARRRPRRAAGLARGQRDRPRAQALRAARGSRRAPGRA